VPFPQTPAAACPAGTVHLPRGIDAEWVKQLVAEQLVTVKTRRGFTRLEWQKLRERNEALNCRVYARAALDRRPSIAGTSESGGIWKCSSVSR
jgi:phage terminase large subunit GpA-like protein